MSEVQRPSDEDYNAADSRRSFLKKLGIFGATVAAGGGLAAVEGCTPESESIRTESFPAIYQVEKGDSPWTLYEKSGWNDGSVEFSDFWDAVKKENSQRVDSESNVDLNHLKPGDAVWIPFKNNGKQGGTLENPE